LKDLNLITDRLDKCIIKSITGGLKMDYEIIIKVSVDPDANFLEVGEINNSNVIKQVVSDCLYDIDDLEIKECEVIKNG
jgi:hypothetical protein|tara:strand:- start:504 stop:740 length:237 start_codon:yes stop_codon:yes gene_type:complete